MIKTTKQEYLEYRTTKVLFKSDLLTTRTIIALSSLLFCMIAFFSNYSLILITISFINFITTFYSLLLNVINKYTFIGEAIFGFLLWNFISLTIIFGDTYNSCLPYAYVSPTFIIGMFTWWVLSRYPKLKK